MSTAVLIRERFYGLFELDTSGTVIYSRMEAEGKADRLHPEFDGRNFFLDVVPFLNASELKFIVDEFNVGGTPATSVAFVCAYEDGPEQVRVLLARMHGRAEDKRTRSILLHIRKGS